MLVEFYIVRDDGLGRRLKDALIERARAGVDVYFVYDEIGSNALPASYRDELRDAGARITPFHSTRGARNRFQLNFRNHRKIVVVDGREAWVGGHNVGTTTSGSTRRWALGATPTCGCTARPPCSFRRPSSPTGCGRPVRSLRSGGSRHGPTSATSRS